MKTVCLLLAGLAFASAYDVCSVINTAGYSCEHHNTTTTDGWVLTLDRIPPKHPNGKVLLFMHGFVDSAVGICLGQPGLPYILSDIGYDVWLGNNRGNGQSMTNKKYNSSQKEFWDFSWDEMALIDLPAHISYVLSATGVSKIAYMGHSEGTVQAFAGFVANPSLADKIDIYIALAPVAYIGNSTSTVLDAMAKLDIDQLTKLLGDGEFVAPSVISKLIPDICKIDPSLCDNVLDAIMGKSTNLNNTRLPYIFQFEPNPSSNKNAQKWAQGIRSRKFERFDYGEKGNEQHYGQKTPPQYDLSKMPPQLKIALFTGGRDALADPKDVVRLLSVLPVKPFVHNEPTYAHMDPLWGIDAHTRIYPTIVALLTNATAFFPEQ